MMHSLSPSGCRGDVFMAAMQVGLQLQVIGKRVKSYTMSVDDARKVRLHIQHEQNWAKVEPCGTEQTMYKQQMRYHRRIYTTRYVLPDRYDGTISKLFHAGQIDARVAATAARDRQCQRQLLNQVGRVDSAVVETYRPSPLAFTGHQGLPISSVVCSLSTEWFALP